MRDIRPISGAEAELFRARLARAFGWDEEAEEGGTERFLELFDLERTVAVFEDDDMIGTGAAFSLELTVPGRQTVPMGGTTVITVQPTHRRQGILREIMEYHLDEVGSRGEPIAGLWASESGIYGRFGYGPATFRHEVELDTGVVTLRESSPGRVTLVEADKAEPILRSVFERVQSEVPGMFVRTPAWWANRRMRDEPSDRGGKSARRYAVYEQGGSVDGYATYRQKGEWRDFVAQGEIEVNELIAATPEAHRALWGYLTNIDLFTKLQWWNVPVDDPLPFEITDPRRVRRRLSDAMWVRIMDVPRALQARSYEYDASLTLELDDGFRPDLSGSYRLDVSSGEANCEKIDGKGDLLLDIDVLGHLYLGGGNAIAMARAGRIEGSSESVSLLHRLFRCDRAPWCPEVF